MVHTIGILLLCSRTEPRFWVSSRRAPARSSAGAGRSGILSISYVKDGSRTHPLESNLIRRADALDLRESNPQMTTPRAGRQSHVSTPRASPKALALASLLTGGYCKARQPLPKTLPSRLGS